MWCISYMELNVVRFSADLVPRKCVSLTPVGIIQELWRNLTHMRLKCDTDLYFIGFTENRLTDSATDADTELLYVDRKIDCTKVCVCVCRLVNAACKWISTMLVKYMHSYFRSKTLRLKKTENENKWQKCCHFVLFVVFLNLSWIILHLCCESILTCKQEALKLHQTAAKPKAQTFGDS